MPVRIYALAKELKLDSKLLVDICTKAGVTGKGSALASLDDDEVQRVKNYLAAGAAKKPASGPPAAATAAAPQTPLAPIREETPADERATARRVIGRRPSAPLSSKLKAEKAGEPEPAEASQSNEKRSASVTPPTPEEPATAAEPEVAKAKESEVLKASDTAAEPQPPPASSAAVPERGQGPLSSSRRDSFMPSSGGKVRVIGRGNRAEREGGSEGKASRPTRRRDPSIKVNLAALPDNKPAQPKSSAAEPPAQKPEIRFTKDAIAGHRQGDAAGIDQAVLLENENKKSKVRAGGLTEFAEKAKDRKGRDFDSDEAAEKRRSAGMAGARPDRGRGRRLKPDEVEAEPLVGRAVPTRRRPMRSTPMRRRKGINTAAPRKEAAILELPCSVRDFCAAAGVPVAQVLKYLMSMGTMVNINATIDHETAELLAAELDLDLQLKAQESLEDELISSIESTQDEEASLVTRPPIVTFLGHVDHGKTSLLDYLMGMNVVSREAGGITQHIRAYTVEKDDRQVTFVDTPGHEAFTEMRARGANVTDIAVLVVAADDGIMPQTEEAISHIKAAGVPIVVALNKSDLEGTDPMRVMTQLTEHQLTPSEWGGDVEVVRTSAVTGMGMDELLDTLLTVAELHEYRANPDRKALGVCIESEQLGDRGVMAKLVVQNGTLNVGDVVVCGSAYGRVRALAETLTGRPVQSAGPSMPVNVMGLSAPPGAGDRFYVLDDITQAREIAESRSHGSRTESLAGSTTKVSFEHFQELLEQGRLGAQEERTRLNLIIRSDVRGSLEAIEKEISKLDHPEVELRVLQRSVGGVTLADVTLASASDAVILAFNVTPDEAARSLADERGIEIRRYSVIYKLADELKAMIEGRLRPEQRVVELGRALVKQTFQISRVGTVAGCYVIQGSIQRGCRIRVTRDGRIVGEYPLDALRRIKEDVKEVARGLECGVKLSGFNDVKPDDVLEAYKIEEIARTLD